MWLKTKTEYAELAIKFATDEKVLQHYDRMGYGSSPQALKDRRNHVYIGKIAEQTVFAYLKEQLGLDIITDGGGNGADLFDFKIRNSNNQSIGDVKSFHIWTYFRGIPRTIEEVENSSWALVPIDQYKRRKDLYIFAMVFGDSDMPNSPHKTGDCFVKWATYKDISDWRYISKGSRGYFPYFQTRTDNYGQKMSECRPMEIFLQEIGQFQNY